MVVERLHPGKGSTFCDRGSNLVDGGRQTSGNRKQFRMKYRAVAREGGNSFENCAWRTGSPGIISRERNFHWWISNLEHGRKQKPPIWMKTAERAARRLFFFFFEEDVSSPPPCTDSDFLFQPFLLFAACIMPYVKLEEKKKVVTSKGFF